MDNITLLNNYLELPDRIIIRRSPSKKIKTSYGAIVFCDNSWLMVRKRITIEFSIIINGKYRKSELKMLMKKITLKERNTLEKLIDNEISFDHVFKNVNHYKLSKDSAELFFNTFKHYIKSLINTECNRGIDYYFPKGRKNESETEIAACIRETLEETGIDISKGKLVDPMPIADRFVGYNNIIYENYFWVYKLDQKKETSIITTEEISEAVWIPTEKVSDLISQDKIQTFINAKKLIL